MAGSHGRAAASASPSSVQPRPGVVSRSDSSVRPGAGRQPGPEADRGQRRAGGGPARPARGQAEQRRDRPPADHDRGEPVRVPGGERGAAAAVPEPLGEPGRRTRAWVSCSTTTRGSYRTGWPASATRQTRSTSSPTRMRLVEAGAERVPPAQQHGRGQVADPGAGADRARGRRRGPAARPSPRTAPAGRHRRRRTPAAPRPRCRRRAPAAGRPASRAAAGSRSRRTRPAAS